MKAAASAAAPSEAFLNAASPGVIALFQPNDHYKSQDDYLEAVAEAMRAEYELITASGLLVQIDAPDLAMGRHTMYRDRSVEEFLNRAAKHIEVLNHALRNVAADRVRMHVCWGNYEGPHHHDVPLERLLPVVARARIGGLLIEGANPRHAHEWAVFRDFRVPEDKIVIPGVISSTTNYVEHPLLVAERICRYADLLGRERVIAGSDCGFGTFAGFGPVDPDVTYLKLRSLAEGAAIASAGYGAGIESGTDARWRAVHRNPRRAPARRTAGRGPAVLFVHGWALDLDMWTPQFAALANRYRLIAFDRRGFGFSTGAPGIEHDVADIEQLLAELSLEQIAIVGMSQGARVALRWAMRFAAQNDVPRSRRPAARPARRRSVRR